MGDTSNDNEAVEVKEKPVQGNGDIIFPPFPEPTQNDFEEDITYEEREFYKNKFSDLNIIKTMRLHCTACDRHLGCSARNESRMRIHPMLRTLVCQTCLTFYNSGEFDKGDDGSELYCRWCGQGGQVYCCADCPHVFCAKCIKRNLGVQKIKEIEELDDWKCFKCNPRCIWDLRAICWAILRYCDLKNQIAYKTQDPDLKEKYQKSCIQDSSECCKRKTKAREKNEPKKKDESLVRKTTSSVITKMPPTIQVKKFASINIDDNIKEKKPQKRPASPKGQQTKAIPVKNPIAIAHKPPNTINFMNKRIKLCPTALTPIRITMDKKPPQTYSVVRQPRMKPPPITYNGFNSTNSYTMTNDNINLSLESLTQGLDMSAVAAMSGGTGGLDDDVVCTPDFPMEPLCEVTEDAADDDVQCMTPAPTGSVSKGPPPLLSRNVNVLHDLSPGNVIQMTDNDVTVNAATGGLKFRVDPQTLSSNKMYRLPDGRIFAINANPSMPGGYSATIVAVTDNLSSKVTKKGATYAAKLSAVMTQPSTPTPTPTPKPNARSPAARKNPKRNISNVSVNSTSTPKYTKATKPVERRSSRPCDLDIPIEWYRYNLIDAVDALEYSLSRFNQLKQQASTMFLRTRTLNEMRHLHRTLERLLNTSANRFIEIKENLNKEFKNYIERKQNSVVSDDDDDDDDVEILPDNDDPIFIDENSMESHGSHEVDLTGHGSSEHDGSGKSLDKTYDNSNVNNDDCIQVDSNKSMVYDIRDTEENNTETLKDPLMPDVELNDEVPKDIEQGIAENTNSDELSDKDQKSENETLTENQEKSECKEEMSVDGNINEDNVSKENESTNISEEKIDVKVSEKVLDNNGVSEKETDNNKLKINKEDNGISENKDIEMSEKEKPGSEINEKETEDIEMSEKEKPDREIKNKNEIEDVKISEKETPDSEITNEKEIEDIEMSEAAIEDSELGEKATDDNEMSDIAIEELLKDDNESINDSVNNHSGELSEEKNCES